MLLNPRFRILGEILLGVCFGILDCHRSLPLQLMILLAKETDEWSRRREAECARDPVMANVVRRFWSESMELDVMVA